MNRYSSWVVVILSALVALMLTGDLLFAEPIPSGAEFVFPKSQQSTMALEADITREIAELKKTGTRESLAEAAKIEEKLRAARRVKNGEPPMSPELELHVVGLYEGKASPEIDGLGAKVHVTMTHAPLILCLTSYEPVTWMMEVDDRVDLRQVILGGQNGSVTGLPEGIPVADYSRPSETGKHIYYAYKKNDEDSGSAAYERLSANLEAATGMRPTSFDGEYGPRKTFVVGPESKVWCEEQSYSLMRDAWLLATRAKREAIWNELATLRFPASSSTFSDPFHRQGAKYYYGTHSVLGPIKGLQHEVESQRNGREHQEGEFRMLRPTGEVDALKWDTESHLPQPRGFTSSVFDSKRNRWVMIGGTRRGRFMYAWSATDQKWSALRSTAGMDIHGSLTYSAEHDRLYGIGKGMILHTGRDYPIIYTLHPMGAALSRLQLDRLDPYEPGRRHSIQTDLAIAGGYFLMRETEQHRGDPEAKVTVKTQVIDPQSGNLIASVPGFGIATVEEQQELVAAYLTTKQKHGVGHLAEIPRVKEKARKPKRKPGAPRQAVAALENPLNGHCYEIVMDAGDMTWKQAMTFAANSFHQGARGHLVTITSKEENDFLVANFAGAGDTWAGGSDAGHEGVWEWMCGPEIGDVFYEVNGNDNGFHNWAGRGANVGRAHEIEPNNSGNKEHYLHWNWRIGGGRGDGAGNWNDWDADRTCRYVIVEYSTTPTAIEFNRKQSRTRKPEKNEQKRSQSTFDPSQADAVYFSWNEGWHVYGYSLDANAWSTWSSPNAQVTRNARLAVGEKYIAIVSPSVDSMGWLLDRETAKWTKLPPDGAAVAERRGDVIVGIENVQGRVRLTSVNCAHFVGDALIVLKARGASTNTRIFDVQKKSWRSARRSPLSARMRSLNGASKEHAFMFGGYPNSLQDGAVYVVQRDRWMHLPQSPVKFKYGTDSAVAGGNFVVFGGQEQRAAAMFDVNRGGWQSLDDVPFDTAMSGVAVLEDEVFVWSGYEAAEREAGACDLKTGKWRRISFGPLKPRCLTHSSVAKGKVIFFGGWDASNESFVMDGAIYDPAEDTWTPMPKLPAPVPLAFHPGW